MPGINKVILVGHLENDPDMRRLDDDITITSFRFATSENIIKKGNKIETMEWHNIIMHRKLAENALSILHKGSVVYLEGKVRTRSFIDNDGIKRYISEILVDRFTLLGRKSDFADPEISH